MKKLKEFFREVWWYKQFLFLLIGIIAVAVLSTWFCDWRVGLVVLTLLSLGVGLAIFLCYTDLKDSKIYFAAFVGTTVALVVLMLYAYIFAVSNELPFDQKTHTEVTTATVVESYEDSNYALLHYTDSENVERHVWQYIGNRTLNVGDTLKVFYIPTNSKYVTLEWYLQNVSLMEILTI